MNEKTLLIIALICIALGIPVLYFSSKSAHDDPRVLLEVKGKISGVHSNEKVTILSIEPVTKIPVVIFKNEQEFEKGQYIIAKGRLSEYRNGLEFVAEDIQVE